MKTLFISAISPDLSTGGIERYVKNTIDYCVQHSIDAVFLLPAAKVEGTERFGKTLIIRKNFLHLNPKKLFGKKEIPQTELKKKSQDFFNFIKDLIVQENINIINAQEFTSTLPPIYSLALHMVALLKNIPLVLTMHSFATTKLEVSLIKDLSWEKILCVSKSVAGDCFNKHIPINRLHVDYLGTNTEAFKQDLDSRWLKKRLKIAADNRVILHASRLIDFNKDILKEKGIVALIEAFSNIASKDQKVVLVLALAMPPDNLKKEFYHALNTLKGYIQLHNLEQNIVIGKFKLEEMPLVYAGIDIFVLASENETFGQVLIEAMACGKPVIATNVGGIPEIITDHENGFLIEPNNPSMLAQRIEELLYDQELRNAFIAHGLKIIKRKFTAEKQFRALFSYLEKLSNALEKH